MRFILLCVAMLTVQAFQAQEYFTIMSYNVLNFPNGEPLNRQDTLQKIIDFVEPDLLLLQELKSAAGLTSIAEESCSHLEGNYVAAEWKSQQSNPGTSWPLQQSLVYNSDKFTLYSQGEVLTNYRDFNEYVLYYNSEELVNNQDTSFMYIYVTHLKSSQGENNEQLRLGMVENFTEYLNTLPQDAQVILGGDFNVYNSDEPAYQALLSTDNAIILEDPIDMPGDWHSSTYPDKSILTQSTRTSSIFNDGAGGGIDDRFDFVLCSENMIGGDGAYQYVPNSYYALGNNGDCYNQSITSCIGSNFTVPTSVMLALYYMSDHLPVILQVQTDQTSSIKELRSEVSLRSNVVSESVEFTESLNEEVSIYSTSGKLMTKRLLNSKHLNVATLANGIYLLQLENGQTIKFLKH